jgi:hypothetical protein
MEKYLYFPLSRQFGFGPGKKERMQYKGGIFYDTKASIRVCKRK